MTAHELIKELVANGWVENRQKGSHRILKKENNPLTLAVPDHGHKDLKPGLLSKLRRNGGLR